MLEVHAAVEVQLAVSMTGSIIASPGYLKLSNLTLHSEIYGFTCRDV